MKRKAINTDYYPNRGIRISDKVWKEINSMKRRDESWNAFLERIFYLIDEIKKI